jgi:membrane-bound lytic murein transglycosylase D
VRLQRGLRERTDTGLRTAQRYLPQMERTFASYGLPTGLTRLPMVESSFNVEAYSKDAAAGIWQFIPSSARIYMRLNDVVDDRRDPWIATDAAARHLKDDYDLLQDWPLAVTAYNHGRAGIKRALATVNGDSLSDLIERFDGPRFGFASRNFYAEFLAATDTERAWRARNQAVASSIQPLRFDTVTTRDYVSFDALRRASGVDAETFRALNPAYRPEVISGRLFVPPGHELRVPAGMGSAFKVAYSTLPASERSSSQRQLYASHTVKRGESLARLAKRYGVSSSSLLAANGLDSASSVRAGTTLRIPQREPTTMVASATRSLSAAAETSSHGKSARKITAVRLRVHTVENGQTLSGIAKRYQVTVKELREVNSLSAKDQLRVGSTLKIPAA